MTVFKSDIIYPFVCANPACPDYKKLFEISKKEYDEMFNYPICYGCEKYLVAGNSIGGKKLLS